MTLTKSVGDLSKQFCNIDLFKYDAYYFISIVSDAMRIFSVRKLQENFHIHELRSVDNSIAIK